MTTLNIGGKRVRVDDSFKGLSPEQQNATVEEIVRSISGAEPAPQAEGPTPPSQATPNTPSASYGDALTTWLEGAISGIPIAGPLIQKGADYLATEVGGRLSGQNPTQMRAGLDQRRAQRTEQYPASALSGNLAGAIAGTGAAGATATGSRLLGITGDTLLGRVGASAASNAAVSGADTAVRGGSGADIINNTVIGGGLGGAIPAAGTGIRAGLGALGERIAPTVNAVRAPEQEAQRRLGTAVARDVASNPTGVAGPVDEVAARISGVPLINADRGGETTRALARSVANQSPEARSTIEKVASDRFGGQSQRASDFIRLVTGGAVDDLGYQQAIRDTARYVNKPAYNRAYADPRAQDMWHEGFEQLMQAPAMQRAAAQATTRGANRATLEGFTPIKNPFEMVDGRMTLRRNPDGSIARPNLQFWDQTKRNLDSMIGKAERAGDNTYAGDLKALRGHLVDMTDQAVPSYQKARQGAASFFGAEDAIEAGKKFATSPRSIPEARKAFEKFSGPEKAAFQTGFASELIDRIKAVGDRSNVINQVFKSQAAREQMELVFGPQKLRQIEAYVRVEDLADRLRGAMGGSTTTRQLVELGIGTTGGYAFGGDLQSAATGALLARGAGALSKVVSGTANAKVMERIAQMLVSDDPKMIQAAVKQASQSPAFMRALEDIGGLLAAPVRGTALTVAQ